MAEQATRTLPRGADTDRGECEGNGATGSTDRHSPGRHAPDWRSVDRLSVEQATDWQATEGHSSDLRAEELQKEGSPSVRSTSEESRSSRVGSIVNRPELIASAPGAPPAVASQSSGSAEPNFVQALRLWSDAIGVENVSSAEAAGPKFHEDLALRSVSADAVVRPANLSELQSVLAISRHTGIPLYPVSGGLNWGYGSACPASPGAVVCDLSRMNRIVEVNSELAYIVVEPGVTQKQLYDFLSENHPELCMDVTGASPLSSIVGNIVERGYGQSPYGDRFLHSCGFEVLLADGRVLQTGFGHFAGAKATHLYKWGIGPYLDGIFTQSNFGIVTKVGMWLMPKPEKTALLTISFETDDALFATIDQLRMLKLQGFLPSTVHISSQLRVLSCFRRFPYDRLPTATSLAPVELARIRKESGVAPWTLFTSLRGSPAQVRAARAEIGRSIRRCVSDRSLQIDFIDERSVRWAGRFGRFYTALKGRTPAQTDLLYRLVRGEPTDGPTFGTYWRKRHGPSGLPADPVQDRCGFAWTAPILPATRRDLETLLGIIHRTVEVAGIDRNLTLTMLSERALCCTIGLAYDRDDLAETERVRASYHDCLEECMRHGYIPYRHGINVDQVRDLLFDGDDVFWNVCQTLKRALDPYDILSPGRYGLTALGGGER